MKELPILMSAPMVRAILTDKKTQTRRLCKVNGFSNRPITLLSQRDGAVFFRDAVSPFIPQVCPYGTIGDRLYVRETWQINAAGEIIYRADTQNDGPVDGRADQESKHWKPSIHMPRTHSRITLEVLSVRVERVQDISEEDAWAEGVDDIARTLPYSGDDLGRVAFSGLWEDIYAARGYGWEMNPWVWCVSFKQVQL